MALLKKIDTITICYLLLLITYVSGLFIPLMENDSAQHATMAMRMYLENDFTHIIKGHTPYLDKPHMHFWLSALSFKLFGISEISYRIPSILFLFLGAFATFKLALLFYKKEFAHYTSLIFLSSQTIILSAHDVRTDAVLTGASILSLWQLIYYLREQKLMNLIIGSMFLGIAFGSKGLIAVVFVGICIFCYLLYERSWRSLLNLKTIFIGLIAFLISISPVLYSYYIQFDLHPELVVNGFSNVSGVRFILWDQLFNRMNAVGFEQNSPDYSFFFHTLLWAFLPFSILAYFAIFNRATYFFQTRFSKIKNTEFFSLGGFVLILFLISFSKFKLPHYLNSTIPILSILCTSYLIQLNVKRKSKSLQVLYYFQYFTFFIGILLVVLLLTVSFDVYSTFSLIVSFVMLILFAVSLFKKEKNVKQYVTTSVLFMCLINFTLNTQIYPILTGFQSGQQFAKIIKEKNIPLNSIYAVNHDYSWSLDFGTKRNTPLIPMEKVSELPKNSWIYMKQESYDELKNKIPIAEILEAKHFPITRLQYKFLNPATRDSLLKKRFLVKIK